MAINPITEKTTGKLIGWQVRVRCADLLASGQPQITKDGALKLRAAQATFFKEHGESKNDALAFEREILNARQKLAGDIRRGRKLGRSAESAALVAARTVRDAAEYYFNHDSFTSLEPSSQERIRTIVTKFLEWNDAHGRTFVWQWTRELANERIKFVRAHHTKSGIANVLNYNKKIFRLDLERDNPALAQNPFPRLKFQTKHRNLTRPVAFSQAELTALLECSPPYERALWTLFYATGIRVPSEIQNMRRSEITFESGIPIGALLPNTKTHRAREVAFNLDAQDAVTYLLLQSDDSGYLVRRDFLASTRHQPFLRALYRCVNATVLAHPHLRAGLVGTFVSKSGATKPVHHKTIHTFRKTFVTEQIKAGTNIVKIADMIGDKVETLLLHYAALLDAEDRRAAVEKMPRVKVSIASPIQPQTQTIP